MQRFGRALRLREGAEEEYDRRHAAVWPGVLATISRSGIENFNIYRYGRWLFSYFEIPDGMTLDDVARSSAGCEESARWEEFMHTLQEPLPESGDQLWWVPMKEVFHFGK